ncbi:MAG: helix-turn-helix domain-containing protein [Sneathiella sp.]
MRKQGNFNSDAELAEFLKVSKVTIASWRKRNSIPLDKLIYFSQKTMTSIESLIFETGGGIAFVQNPNNYWAIAVAVHFYRTAADHFLYGDAKQTSIWWGKVFPSLVTYYEHEIFAVAAKEDLELEDAAIEVMKIVETLDPAEMTDILKNRLEKVVDF